MSLALYCKLRISYTFRLGRGPYALSQGGAQALSIPSPICVDRPACHTGRRACFKRKVPPPAGMANPVAPNLPLPCMLRAIWLFVGRLNPYLGRYTRSHGFYVEFCLSYQFFILRVCCSPRFSVFCKPNSSAFPRKKTLLCP